MAVRILPDREYVRVALDYDPQTGAFRWRTRPAEHFPDRRTWTASNVKFAGKAAGSVHTNGAIRIMLNGSLFYAHRLAWLLTHGKPVPHTIDHADGDPSNNRIGNLRAASRADNGANARRRRDNQIGVKGIRLMRSGSFEARIQRRGRTYYLGRFVTLDEARAAWRDAAHRLHGAFARHD